MKTFHIEAEEGQIAKTVLMPGDPMRAKYIAEHYLTDVICYSQVRGMIVTDMREHPFEAETVEFAVEVDEKKAIGELLAAFWGKIKKFGAVTYLKQPQFFI